MSTGVSFDGAPPEGTINFGVDQPSADLLPVDLMRHASSEFYATASPLELNYGVREGDPRFLHVLAEFLTRGYGATVQAQELFVTGGNSQALDLASTVFARPGDTVFVEEPSYFLAFQIFRDHGLKLVGVPLDRHGIDVNALESLLQQHRPAFLYTIPSYQNPGGQCLPLKRRKRLVELSQQHGFVIVADEVYQLLNYGVEPPPPMGVLNEYDTVVSMGSFSKILAPGLRLGWIQAGPELRAKLQASGFINSGGSINHIASHLVRSAIDLGLQQEHLEKVRSAYRSRAESMEVALQKCFADIASWQKPQGGYFFWLKWHEHKDTAPLKALAARHQAGFQPGSVFSSMGGLQRHFRLSFAHYNENEIVEGVRRLRKVFDLAASRPA